MMIKKTTLLLVTLAFFIACKKKETEVGPPVSSGVLILNEGNFGSGNGSVSVFDRSTGEVRNSVFENVNGYSLGDVVQSMKVHKGEGYIVVNNSNKVEVVDMMDFSRKSTITGLSLPRYTEVAGSRLFVSEYVSYGSKGRISVIDLFSKTIIKQIEVGELPEQMIYAHGKLYVANSGEDFISVIDPGSLSVVDSISVISSPNSLVRDNDGNVWVLSAGKKAYNTDWTIDEANSEAGGLVKVNSSGDVTFEETFTDKTAEASDLGYNNKDDILYYNYRSAVYSRPLNGTSSQVIPRAFYALGYDPETNYLYGGSATFVSNDYVVRYTTSGSLVDSFQVGIGPAGFVFQ